jgi:hypothetical protein
VSVFLPNSKLMSEYKHIFLILSLFVTISCKQQPENNPSHHAETRTHHQEISEPAIELASSPVTESTTAFPEAAPDAHFALNIIPGEANTYGYEILREGKPIIRQTTIPGMPGNKAFASKADAEKVGTIVIGKLKKGEMPHTVTAEELGEINIIFKPF